MTFLLQEYFEYELKKLENNLKRINNLRNYIKVLKMI